MKKIILSSFLAISLYGQNLEALIDIALKNNTTIKQAQIKVDNQKHSITKAKSTYLPTLTLDSDISTHDIKTAGTTTDGQSDKIALSSNQLLYDFDKSSSSIDASKQNYEASKKELASTKANIILNVKKVYYDILNKEALIAVAKESVKIDELQLFQAKEYFDAKVKTKIDVTNAKLQLSNSQLKLLSAKYDLKKAKAKLITLLGESNILISKDKVDIKDLAKKVKEDKYNLEQLLALAKTNRAELKMYKYLQKALMNNYESVRSEDYPSINLVASYEQGNSDDISSLDKEQFTAGVYLKWELFSGFRTSAAKKEALNDLLNIKEDLKEQELNIIENVSDAYFDVEQNKQSIEISLLNISLAEQNLELARQRYKNGLNDIIELNTAKLDFITAKNDLVNQYYAYKISLANLQYETGTINDKKID